MVFPVGKNSNKLRHAAIKTGQKCEKTSHRAAFRLLFRVSATFSPSLVVLQRKGGGTRESLSLACRRHCVVV